MCRCFVLVLALWLGRALGSEELRAVTCQSLLVIRRGARAATTTVNHQSPPAGSPLFEKSDDGAALLLAGLAVQRQRGYLRNRSRIDQVECILSSADGIAHGRETAMGLAGWCWRGCSPV